MSLGHLRRASKHWRRGDKCLAAIHLAQTGFGKLDEEGAYRLSLAAEPIEVGVTLRKLGRELGLSSVQFDVSKYEDNQLRVPAGSGRESAANGRRGARLRGPTPRRRPREDRQPGLRDGQIIRRSMRPERRSKTGRNWNRPIKQVPRFSNSGLMIYKASNTFFDEYVPAANYAIGVYMAGAGAGYGLARTYVIAQDTLFFIRPTGTNTGAG